jgi:YYY domain-containing protein
MIEAITWWLAIELIGLAAFPLAFVFFRFLPDRGYSFSKVFGLLLLSYFVWIGASAHVIPNHRWSIILLLVLITAVSLAVAAHRRTEIAGFLRERWHHLLIMETLFSIVFFFALLLRSYVPDIGSVESPYDFAFINGIIRSDYFPAKDPWLSGHSIPIYHFGYLIIATLTKLTSIPSRITFNLSLALIVALTFSAAFGLVYNLVAERSSLKVMLFFGLLGVFLLAAMGNVEGFFELLAAHGIGSHGFYSALDIAGLNGPRSTTAWYPTEWNWYGRAVQIAGGPAEREFPFFSFLQGYVHGHTLALPFVLMAAGVALNVWRRPVDLGGQLSVSAVLTGLGIALTLGAVGFVNIWDLPPALLLFAILVLARNHAAQGRFDLDLVVRTAAFVIPVVVLSFGLYLPFYATIHSTGRFGLLETATQSAALESIVTLPHHFLYIWLPFLWLTASFGIAALGRTRFSIRSIAFALLPPLAPISIWAMALIVRRGLDGLLEELATRSTNWITVIVLAWLMGIVTLALVRQVQAAGKATLARASSFALVVAGVALLLILGVEFFWFRDLWGMRSTTLLKVGYHAWVLLSISGAFGVYYIVSAWRPTGLSGHLARSTWLAVTALILGISFVYPVTASFSRADGFQHSRHLDALILIKTFERDEYDASEWLWREVRGTPVILEAVGDSYTGFARVSSRTGLPTVLGWPWHEQLWRGSLAPQAGRKEDVERAYTTTDPTEARAILQQYDVEYVYVGSLERQQYGAAGTTKFVYFMDIAYQNEGVIIYRMPEEGRSVQAP